MKFLLAALMAAPAVMGRACRPRPSALSSVTTTSTTNAAVVPVKTADQETTTTAAQSTPTPAIVVSESSTSAAVASSSASKTVDDESTATDSSTSLGTGTYSGTSTFYGGNLSGGNCMFNNYTLPSGLYGTAYSGAVWNNAAKCGACIEVTGPTHTITAMIVDQCPECAQGHLDLFPDAFTAVGGTDGTVSTSYKFVECGITSPIVVRNKEGTSNSWFSMQVINHNQPVKSLEVSTNGGSSWQATTRRDYNYFEQASGFGVDWMKVRVTSTTGEQIIVSRVNSTANACFTAASNF